MKKVVVAAALLAAQFAFAPQLVAAEEKTSTPQQQRMKDCNKDAKDKDLKGQERKDFMKSCLSGKQSEAKAVREERREERQSARQTQQDKMKTCNADAKTKALKGDERKAFMSDCLKN